MRQAVPACVRRRGTVRRRHLPIASTESRRLSSLPATPSPDAPPPPGGRAAGAPGAPPAYGVHGANFRFPHGFLWGASTSAHQVEGGNELNDWWDWEQAGRVPEKSGDAADHYRRYRDDFDLAQALEHNAHRF